MQSSNVLHVRMDSRLKESVSKILESLGLTEADAVKLFYRQVELHGGLPFDIKLPERILAEKRLMEELNKAEESLERGEFITLEDSKKEFGL